VEKAAQVASEKTGMRITVEQLRLSFPLDLRLQGLKALQPNDSLPGKTNCTIPRNCDFSHFLYLEVGIRLIGSDSHVLIK
ncbi:hypothetical protein, partial [Leyella stercorea]|uniref:hypothetical protein n=1 Tax=Leyella stercorea TaxID=363265 RepID=UPI003A93A786